jgi:hypothetical protein
MCLYVGILIGMGSYSSEVAERGMARTSFIHAPE